MTGTGKRKALLIGVVVVALLLSAMCVIEAFRYPRIARSAYLRYPHLLVAATWSHVFPGSGMQEETILLDAAQLYPGVRLHTDRFYLSDRPKGDRNIRERVFSLIRKQIPQTNDRIFWIVSGSPDFTLVNDDWLVYEYRTGKRIGSPTDSMD
jgi:hypothetical protein